MPINVSHLHLWASKQLWTSSGGSLKQGDLSQWGIRLHLVPSLFLRGSVDAWGRKARPRSNLLTRLLLIPSLFVQREYSDAWEQRFPPHFRLPRRWLRRSCAWPLRRSCGIALYLRGVNGQSGHRSNKLGHLRASGTCSNGAAGSTAFPCVLGGASVGRVSLAAPSVSSKGKSPGAVAKSLI